MKNIAFRPAEQMLLTAIGIALLAFPAALLSGCGSSTDNPVLANHDKPLDAKPAEEPAPSKTPPAPLRVPDNAHIQVRLLQSISSRNASSGDAFDAELSAPIRAEDRIIFSRGTRVRGRVVNASPSGRLHNPGSLTLTLDSIQDSTGRWIPLSTTSVSARGKAHTKRNATLIGGGTGLGALIGGIAGGGKGAAIGAASGAGAGTAGAYATGRKDVTFSAEKKLTFRTIQELVVNR
jgi:hypothetical protein